MLKRLLMTPLAGRLWRWHPWLLAGLWVLVQAAFLLRYHGPHFANDSGRYLDYAANLAAHGHYQPEPGLAPTTLANNGEANFQYEHNQRYLLYPWFQSVWLWLGLGRWGIVGGQLALAALAARVFYGAVRRLAGGRCGAAALATGLLVVWPDIQQFNCYLLTESLFTNLSVLALGALVGTRGGSKWAGARLLAVLLLVALVRPNGFVVAGAAAVAGLAALYTTRRRLFWGLVAGGALAVPLLLVALNYFLITYYIVETYGRGELMFGSAAWAIHPSQPLDMPPASLTGQVVRMGYFAAHNPGFLARLMAGKFLVFFSSIKPYYSLAHRLLSVLVLWPVYWLAARGAGQRQVWQPGRVFLAAVPLLQATIVMLTVDDYDVRFLAPVLPFVFALAALGVMGNESNDHEVVTTSSR